VSPLRTPLVGRDGDLAEIAAALDDADDGRGSLTLIAGEAGIGKTRLAEEAATLAAARGFQVLWGRSWEGGATPAFWPWEQALRAIGGLPATSSPDRFEMFDAVARRLTAAGVARPVALFLEDLHAADRSSLSLLGFIATQLRGARVFLLATYRELELRLLPDAGAPLLRAGRDGRILSLTRLGRGPAAELAGSLGVNGAAIDRVLDVAGGLPLFVCEIARTLRGGTGDPAVPETVRQALRDRLRLLSPAARAFVELAAILGREVAPSLLDASVACVEEVVRAGILEEAGTGLLRFSHSIVRDVVHDDLPAEQRTALHRHAGDALRTRHADEADAPAGTIAHHYLLSGRACAGEAVRFATLAAERSLRQLAFEDAAELLERALAALADAAPGDLAGRAALLILLGTARLRAGDDSGGRAACDEAAALGRRLRAPGLLARSALAYGSVLRPAVVDPILVGMLQEALAGLDGQDALRAPVLARLAGALQPARDPAEPIAMARAAIRSSGDLDPATRLTVLHGAGAALQDVGDPEERLAIDRETLRLAVELGDVGLAVRARLRLVLDHEAGGDVDSAAQATAALQAETRDLGPRWRWLATLPLVMRAFVEARFDRADEHVAAARALAAATQDPGADRCLRLRDFFAALLRERPAELEPAWRHAEKVYAQRPVVDICAALVQARLGRLQEARAALDAGPRDALVAFAADPPTSVLLAEVLDALGDARLAAEVLPRVTPNAARIALWSGLAMTILGPVSRAVALLHRACGALAEAERSFAEAERSAERAGLRLLLPRIRLERGETLVRAGERARGQAMIEAARTGARLLGLDGLAGGAGTPEPVQLRRDGETWVVSGFGETCRLKDSRGLELLARLVDLPEREIHVLHLAVEPGAGDVIDAGDAGEVLDEQARASYRRRVQELRAALDEAEEQNDRSGAARARGELEMLEDELAAAVGLGGRVRRRGSAAERARVNVQRRITDAIRRVGNACPALGRHLERCVRTGIYCRYSPSNPRT
jgi:hypothetical protein